MRNGAGDWQNLSPYGVGKPGAPVQGSQPGVAWNGGIQAIPMRDALDAERAQIGSRMPAAEYPSGYLGTLQSRREDRLLDNVKAAAGQRDTQRGVHVGERIDPSHYFWPGGALSDQAGLMRQASGVVQQDGTVASPRPAPTGTLLDQLLIDNTRMPTNRQGRPVAQTPLVQDVEANREALALLLPDWSMR